MNAKPLINIQKPQTQTIKAVCSLLAWRGRASNPLPQFVEMGEGDTRLVLVLSAKKDAYYTCTKLDCSCPASIYHREPCKHRRQYFPAQLEQATPAQAVAVTLEEASSSSPISSQALSLHASRREEARISVAQSKAQAQAYQAQQRQLRAQAREISSPMPEEALLFQRGGFKPFLEA